MSAGKKMFVSIGLRFFFYNGYFCRTKHISIFVYVFPDIFIYFLYCNKTPYQTESCIQYFPSKCKWVFCWQSITVGHLLCSTLQIICCTLFLELFFCCMMPTYLCLENVQFINESITAFGEFYASHIRLFRIKMIT